LETNLQIQFCCENLNFVEKRAMSTADLKNDLHKLIVETDDPEILEQIAVLFQALLEQKAKTWSELSPEEQQKIQKGASDAAEGNIRPYRAFRDKVKKVLGDRKTDG
jgi:hypothetical protein